MTKYDRFEMMSGLSHKLRTHKELRFQMRPLVAVFIVHTFSAMSNSYFTVLKRFIFPKASDESGRPNKYDWEIVRCQLACAN